MTANVKTSARRSPDGIIFRLPPDTAYLFRVWLAYKELTPTEWGLRQVNAAVLGDSWLKQAFPDEIVALTQSLLPPVEDRVLTVAEELEAAAVERRRKTDAEIDIIEEQIKRSHKVNPGSVPYEDPRKKKAGRGADSKGALGL